MYDAEKEERQLQDARQRELLRIEETKQKAAQLGQVSAWFAYYHNYLRPVRVEWLNKYSSIDLSLLACAARPKNDKWSLRKMLLRCTSRDLRPRGRGFCFKL